MIWLVGGVLLWMGAHLFKRLFPATRAALGRAGRFIVLAAIVASIALMIVGYLEADQTFLYALPPWAWYANNALMWVALFLMDVGQARGVIRTRIRHPMLAGVAVWAVAHLLVNGDVPSLVLFGGLGLWALVEMAVISRAEGDPGSRRSAAAGSATRRSPCLPRRCTPSSSGFTTGWIAPCCFSCEP
jgi:uncharacterized membrane protein